MHLVKYRSHTPGLNPRRTKLEVPGWGGQREPRKDGSMEQAAGPMRRDVRSAAVVHPEGIVRPEV